VTRAAHAPDEPWFVLAIDHRASFRQFAAGVRPGAETDVGRLTALKAVVARAMAEAATRLAADAGGGTADVGLLVDDEYGTVAMAIAREAGVNVIVPAERSGQPEFVFEHGEAFREVIERTDPDAVKALVRYNPSGDASRNSRSRDRLRVLADYCADADRAFMLELLVPTLEGDGVNTDLEEARRPELTCRAIMQLREVGLEPAWWKLEGQPNVQSFADVAVATGAPEPGSGTACLVLGRGADSEQLHTWIVDAARTPGFAGFAVGRSLWWDSLTGVLLGTESDEAAAHEICERYLALVDVYRSAHNA